MPDLWMKTWQEPEEKLVEWVLFSSTDRELMTCRARTQEALRIAVENGIEPGRTDHIRPRSGRSDGEFLMDNREFFQKLQSLR